MTEQLYQTDSYVRDFQARVTAVEGQAVALGDYRGRPVLLVFLRHLG